MGWIMLALIGLTTAALLAVLRLPRLLWPLAGAALMLGAAGYAWQGQPDLAAQPVAADAVKLPPSAEYKKLRDTFFGRFGGESMYFGISDVALTNCDPDFAARALTGMRMRSVLTRARPLACSCSTVMPLMPIAVALIA